MISAIVVGLVALLVVSLIINNIRLSNRVDDEMDYAVEAEGQRDELKRDYDSLLARANELAKEKVAMQRQLQDLNYRAGSALRAPSVESGAIDLTILNKVDGESEYDAEARAALVAAGGVVADQRGVKVDLSGQVKRIKAEGIRVETGAGAQAGAVRLEDGLQKAARRLGDNMAVDILSKDGKPSFAIVSATTEEDVDRAARKVLDDLNAQLREPVSTNPLDYGFLSKVGKE